MKKFYNAVKFVKKVGILEEGDHVESIVSGDFIAGDIIEAYLQEYDLFADEVIIATLS